MAAPSTDAAAPVARDGRGYQTRHDAEDDTTPRVPSPAEALLGGLLAAADPALAAEALAVARPDDLPDPMLRRVAAALLALAGRGESLDAVGVAASLGDEPDALRLRARLGELLDVADLADTPERVLAHARTVRREARAQRERVLAARVAELPANDARRESARAELARLAAERESERELEAVAVAPSVPSWPAPLGDAAYIGPLGDYVRALAPHTEADLAALLLQALAAFGSAAGRHRYYEVEGDRHYPNLFVAIVGDTSKGRKGTSWGRTHGLVKAVDETWQTASGLSSGEGLIWAVRDPVVTRHRVRGGGYEDVESDPGVADKRLLVVESELAQTLKVLAREGNTLSPVIRAAWDSGELRSLTRNTPARATGAHVSIIGHITAQELRRELDATEAANGFANRFLFVAARRSRELPFGGRADTLELSGILRRLADALYSAREPGLMALDAAARERWASVYSDLSRGRPGLLGAVTGRAEAQTVRLALVYALSEGADRIGLRHLDGALAIWAYCAASAAYVFGDALGDRVADAALAAIREAGAEGVSRTDLRDLLGRGYGDRLTAALATLAAAGLAHGAKVVTGRAGRRAERWYPGRGNGAASDHAPFPKSPKSPESSESGAAEGYSGDFGDSGQGEPFGDEPPPPDDGDAPAWTAEEPEDWSEVVP